jgi:hypothetical protein
MIERFLRPSLLSHIPPDSNIDYRRHYHDNHWCQPV